MLDAHDRLRITQRSNVVSHATLGLGVFWMSPGILSRKHAALIIRVGYWHLAFIFEVNRDV